jgi:SpoVK/Ycf46/Vps4 family AAA+-type ATPase
MRAVMLYTKFEQFLDERVKADNKEMQKARKIMEKEHKKRDEAKAIKTISQKQIKETFTDKENFIKMMKGPFCQLESEEGLRKDDFYTCAEKDLITAANKTPYRIMIIGKPRSGKTLLSSKLCTKLDLVHINLENWINTLVDKIKNREPEDEEPAELEEGQEPPPKFLTDFEEEINMALKSG